MNRVLVVGASQGIGLALVKRILLDNDVEQVFATYRSPDRAGHLNELKKEVGDKLSPQLLCIDNPLSYSLLYEEVSHQVDSLDHIIYCIGTLFGEKTFPEKSIFEVTQENLVESLKVNAIPLALLVKEFMPLLLASDKPVVAALSAKVGSISDNRLGGWYSYRASKAALNMIVKNLSVEIRRKHRKSSVLSIHPGTTKTRLSERFIESALKKYTVHTPDETAANIVDILKRGEHEDLNGRFFSWDGSEINW